MQVLWCDRDIQSEEPRHVISNLHAHGFHHHDLKPENFVRTCQDSVLKLIDFEFATSISECSGCSEGQIFGEQRDNDFCMEGYSS